MSKQPTKIQLEQIIRELESEKRDFARTVVRDEERYRTIFEYTGNATILIAEDTTILLANSNFASLVGYTREEMEGKMSWTGFIVPEDLAMMKQYHFRRRETKDPVPNSYEFRLKSGTGEIRDISLTVALVPGTKESVASCMDVTERKRAMEALSQSEEKYRNILETMEEAYFEINPQGNYTFFNTALCRILGYPREELTGMNYKATVTPESLKTIPDIRRELSATGSTQNIIIAEVIRKDGVRRNIEFSVSLLRGQTGEPTGFRGIGRDVTDRIQAQQKIKDSEKRYRLLAENLTDVIWVLDPNLNYIYVSPSIESLRGYTPEEEMHQSLEQRLTPDSYKTAMDIFAQESLLEQSGQRHDRDWVKKIELEMTCKDGSTIWTELTINIFYNDHGEPQGLLGVTRDITKRRKAEQDLIKKEELYRTIFEHTATANMIVAEDTTILLVNSNFEKLNGFLRHEVENKMSWTQFVVPEDLEKMKQRHVKRRIEPAGAPSTYEFRGVIKSGEIRNLFMSVAMIPGTQNSIASLIDMTDYQKAQDNLRQSEERFRDMARLLPETIFETDMTGKLTFVNEISFARFGYTRDDVEKGLKLLDVLAPEERERVRANAERFYQGKNFGLSEYLARKKDGTIFPVLVHSTPIIKDGFPAGTRGFLVDMSDKKAMEDQLLRAQKMEAIGTLAGGIAHDFNNLLMGILGNLSMLLMHLDETHPFHDRLRTMEEYVQRGSNLTRQLLGFARGGKYEVRTTNLGKFVLRSVDVFGRTKKDIAIHHKTNDAVWYVDVDRGQMDQVLLNLFVNAWQAMPSGGNLYVSVENTELRAEQVAAFGVPPGKFVKLTVTDTGVGMDEATKSHIFEPFFSTKERGHGTGLGLASVYGIIKNHGGFISVESEKGVGTSFIIYLPASERKLETEPVKENKLYEGQETILLIDDEEMIVDVGTQMLEGLGYRVLTATGGRQGITIFENHKETVDLVILDMIMPDLGGKETFEALLRLKPSVKALLSSGYSEDGLAKEIMDGGCKGFIQKPFTMVELSRKLREILGKD
ncbi:MAG: hypothetical protein CVU71_12595 [Deltaproteobacteria bacterium HGW-Deltaproteobacteria-6]|jgi:PAS domain S-box-containing protein|nr:MAG: hypothetical protein CVU71_12595 [Deltaproteobacteria bacterium HGW-Deltaproteobacteria-6]